MFADISWLLSSEPKWGERGWARNYQRFNSLPKHGMFVSCCWTFTVPAFLTPIFVWRKESRRQFFGLEICRWGMEKCWWSMALLNRRDNNEIIVPLLAESELLSFLLRYFPWIFTLQSLMYSKPLENLTTCFSFRNLQWKISLYEMKFAMRKTSFPVFIFLWVDPVWFL